MNAVLFWNRPLPKSGGRLVDPLGFDALREAMADVLLPWLTGGTRDSDEYLWTLIGLRWAQESTGSLVDAAIFNRGFAPFERALKQYWCKKGRSFSGGVVVIKKICQENEKPDIQRPILQDQRGAGLLGAYITSLRAMELVKPGSLRVNEAEADSLLGDIRFKPKNGWTSSWSALNEAFAKFDLKPARKQLGARLFSGANAAMRCAAESAQCKPQAEDWTEVDMSKLPPQSARVARATKAIATLEKTALQAFRQLLHGNVKLSRKTLGDLQAHAPGAEMSPLPLAWPSNNPMRRALEEAFHSFASRSDPANTLLKLHLTVTREIRRTEPWISELGERAQEFEEWQPNAQPPDFRFCNLRNLLRQTRWRPNAH
jgi:hypothetical protein